MAKQIKVIKCPQCGNSKPVSKGNDHYRCDKCDTEFFLDNDDININVNHQHKYESQKQNNSLLKGIVSAVIVILVLSFILLASIRSCINRLPNTNSSQVVKQNIQKDKSPIILLNISDRPIAFYLEKQIASSNINVIFKDVISGELLKAQSIPTSNKASTQMEHRRFLSDNIDYIIINNRFIYQIKPNEYLLEEITDSICSRKPALNSGLTSVSFVPEGQGEGFLINTNLGKELYYFPKSDMLYSEKAFQYVAEGKSETLLPDAKEAIYYLFLNKESVHSSNVAQLFEITYLFNNGGPESKLLEYSKSGIKDQDKHRIISYKPITEELTCFSPQILYYDDKNILISSQATLAKDAVTNIQLLDTSGKILWTQPFSEDLAANHSIRTQQGFMLQTGKKTFCEISIDGQKKQEYKLP